MVVPFTMIHFVETDSAAAPDCQVTIGARQRILATPTNMKLLLKVRESIRVICSELDQRPDILQYRCFVQT